MPTTILLIENDTGFAREITEALEAAGFRVRGTGDGKEGLDLAKEVAPAAIVLCVELPKMSGYSICQKLKKDEALRGIPLILTSAEATAETFEQHKKLKARAEDYLLKPFGGAELIARLAPLTGLPEAPPATSPAGSPPEEEVVSLEEELGLEALTSGPDGDLPALDLSSLPDEPGPGAAAAPSGGEDEDLQLLDDAFAGLSTPAPHPVTAARLAPLPAAPPPTDTGAALDLALDGDQPVAAADLDAAAASLPLEDEAPGRAQLDGLTDEADLALGALGADESPTAALDALDALDGPPSDASVEPSLDLEAPSSPPMDFAPELAAALDLAPEGAAPQPAPLRGASADALRAAGIPLLDDAPPSAPPNLKVVPPHVDPPAPVPAPRLDGPAASAAELARLEAELTDRRASLAARDAELGELHDRIDALTHRAVEAESALAEREGEVASQKARAEALAAQIKRGEADLKTGREEARRAADQVRAAEDRARAAEAQVAAATEKARAAENQATAAKAQASAAEARASAVETRSAAAAEQARAAEARATAAEAKAGSADARASAAEVRAGTAEARAGAAEAQASAAEARSASATAESHRYRTSASEATRGLEAKIAELAVAAASITRLEAVEREAEELKTELIVARGEVEGARSEVEKRSAELRKRITDLEAANAKNEERVVKAYLKIKGDEKVRDKARKALAIALQLLEEGLPPEAGAPRPPAPGAKLD